MNEEELQYQNALASVEKSIEESYQTFDIPIPEQPEEISQSDLDGWDYCYALAIGIAGVALASNDDFAKYLDEIHKAASGASGDYDFFQSALGKLLHHKGDWIDAIEMPFKNRNGENSFGLFHRLLWGHDIFSFGPDNPFHLMFQQKGILGILQAVRHLLADTTSKQGLPMPFSSLFDYTNKEGKTSNYLISVAQELSQETIGNKANAQEIYAHLSTIRAQDVTAGVVVKILSEVYFKARKIDDEIRAAEIRLIAYAVNFFGEAVVGCVRQNGVPYINIPLAGMLTFSFSRFCYLSCMETRKSEAETEELVQETDKLISDYDAIENCLPKYETAPEFVNSINQSEDNMLQLFDFLEGGAKE